MCVLFNLLIRYKDSSTQVKLPGLIIKALLKLAKILINVIGELNIKRVLIAFHLYLISIDHENKTENDDSGIRIVKHLVHEMVIFNADRISNEFERVVANHEVEDKFLHVWIIDNINTFKPNRIGYCYEFGKCMSWK